jgi:dimethylargininase
MVEPSSPSQSTSFRHALVRQPGQSYAWAISSAQISPDVSQARSQHAGYCQALADAGLEVEILPADERYPDSCFVEDPLLVIDGLAILALPGVLSRQGEEQALKEALKERFPIEAIQAPGTLEGGDVLHLPGRVLVGLSTRSNPLGFEQLKNILDPRGFTVEALTVAGYLHLRSAISYLGREMLLSVPEYAENPAFAGLEVLAVPSIEAYAANALAIGNQVILPEGYPITTELLRTKGFKVNAVPMSQFAAADGGVSCLSVLW